MYWLFKTSIEPEAQVAAVPPNWIPQDPTLFNFESIFSAGSEVTYENRRQGDPATGGFIPTGAKYLLPALWNSFIVGVAVAALNVLLSATAAYAIAMIHFRGRRFTLYTILATRVIPDIALIVPFFLLLRNLGLHQHQGGADHHLSGRHRPVHDLHPDQLFPVGAGRAVQGGAHRRLLASRRAAPRLSAARHAGGGRFADVRLSHQLERVPVRAHVDPEHPGADAADHHFAAFTLDFTISFSFINAAGVIAIVPPVVLAILFERYIVSGLTAGAVKG